MDVRSGESPLHREHMGAFPLRATPFSVFWLALHCKAIATLVDIE